jgi:hypothetical protein
MWSQEEDDDDKEENDKEEEEEEEEEESDGMGMHGFYLLLNSISKIELRMNEMDSACGRKEMYTGLVLGSSE